MASKKTAVKVADDKTIVHTHSNGTITHFEQVAESGNPLLVFSEEPTKEQLAAHPTLASGDFDIVSDTTNADGDRVLELKPKAA